MDHTVFISLAYAATAVLIAALCLSTWARARRVRRLTDARAGDET